MELARAWFRAGRLAVPQELSELLSSSPRLELLEFERAVPELVTGLPERGEGRNHDLWLLGRTPQEQVTVCVEAKADEPFGDKSIGEYLRYALQRRTNGETTRAPERIEALFRMVDTASPSLMETPWAEIPYQLLTAICGTAIQARSDQSRLAVLVVHVFETNSTEEEKLDINHQAFTRFVELITGTPQADVEVGRLYGPARIGSVKCLVGKTEIREQANRR